MVIILCTIHVSTGARLTRNCLASNGRCGRKGLTCDNAFGKEWIKKGRCCNGGPCCKYDVMRDCVDWQESGMTTNGIYSITPIGFKPFDVYCDMTTDGGGWLVFQRRIDGTIDFFKEWVSYENGFGDINSEFWLGNKKLHVLTQEHTELRVDVMAWDNEKRYAKYSTFRLGDASSKYTLYVDGYSGDAGDGLALHHEVKFSTRDQDNDVQRKDCAGSNKGAWWYENCSHSSLNGQYIKGTDGVAGKNLGINWEKFKGDYYSMKTASMKLRRKV
ncbi:Ficolin-1-A,Ryncolin-1,Fibrinogen C domain-containing protein 1,Tenascin-N,Angiopoietin-related protein 7,Ficolin-3,Fibrinogen C domain-containing protein 1-B,Fibrinogen-like protein 1,Ficolin-1,Angiopoietin-4,Tenascin-R,Ryncolin-2,Techylectin-5B,Fibrinogen C domain-containing protein 1-A,Microfibril-associated glycoprotein 4,Fibrinogen-like protein A,Ryncolin-3,Tenascin-X,Ficolin-2,Tenascin,Ryncolin-4,Techylectin-like protein [Mytilus edulis]|uniref:Fibrinogen C-terminal domain-containing protein n=1 Tax=Mytilus edulis TaxID=6550 RepID=A0A8S3TBI7_MYTED|nr:Ficolin-1-A,Ryncolin-1,Fibrinogen C domain-containing protein 1,Tenascin-N,Angiopoietin-related protein 7,Ficolin-3,Fibrinogen C domain-containing protein 1-B,Fibrinogen-like protein 1,Ficolin-1,Angiopoietin-4,Tenascin-R,Ryncolin-2,Techylectin-5B,Fibrinogen C domain-containing protein 1-A,Microfibril-associated glycoprotein 4,Fibrinogen-like protein A,Ryncolin-3,Tenascin-X,Ficolin-2,Tenascin,Ryncolin-4,Techylectin-like protein [Mytilus edulis]